MSWEIKRRIRQCSLHFPEESHIRGCYIFVDVCYTWVIGIYRIHHKLPSAATHHSRYTAGNLNADVVVLIYILVNLHIIHKQQAPVPVELPFPCIVIAYIAYTQVLVGIEQITSITLILVIQ